MATANGERPEAAWNSARLIPAVGSKNDKDREQRATSSLLAVMGIVKGFGRTIVSKAGGPAGTLSTFIEVGFDTEDRHALRPDGAIIVERGKTRWACLVEVKTGSDELRTEQIEGYLDLARANAFDAVLTITNDIASATDEVPVLFDRRKARGLTLKHVSWWRILTLAIEEQEHRGVEDPEQAYILGELIRYLQDNRSGASGFEGMGPDWVKVRDGIHDGTLQQGDPRLGEIAGRWEEFIEYVSLELRQQWGVKVEPNWPRKSKREDRLGPATKQLIRDGSLTASIKVPHAAAPIDLTADLRTRRFTTSAEISAPKVGRAKTRINWMLRQTRDMPDDLLIDVRYPNVRESVSARNGAAQANPELLLYQADPKREARAFRLHRDNPMGRKAGKDKGSFVGESRKQMHDFYRDVLQNVHTWQPPAPRLAKEPETVPTDDGAPPVPQQSSAMEQGES
jgi:hypothetical protein